MYILARLSLILVVAFAAPLPASAQSEASGILVTSSGQALDAFTTKTLLTRAGIENRYDQLATHEDLEGVETLVVAFGASLKGFGAAGITAETEAARTRALLAAAKEQGIEVIGVHIGGAERRGGLSEQFVEIVSGEADALVVWEAGNQDDYFIRVADERGIPLTLIEQPMKVAEAISGYLND